MSTAIRCIRLVRPLVVAILVSQVAAPIGALAVTQLWSRIYNGPAGYDDHGAGVAVGKDGSVYVVGTTWVDNQYNNLILRKYTATGTLLWSKTYNSPLSWDDGGSGIAIAPDGSIYVTGWTEANLQAQNVLLLKYTAAGTLLWTRTYNSASSGAEEGRGVAVGRDGSVYVAGQGQVPGQDYEALLLKYSATGNRLWVRTYGGTAKGWDSGAGVAVSSDGYVYMTGFVVNGPLGEDERTLFLRKYSTAGTLKWGRLYAGIDSYWDWGNGVAAAPGGYVYVTGVTRAGTLLLHKYSSAGARVWGRYIADEEGFGVAVGPDGGVYVTGQNRVAAKLNLSLRKFSASGTPLWGRLYDGPDKWWETGTGVAAGPDNSVCVSGELLAQGADKDLLLLKFK